MVDRLHSLAPAAGFDEVLHAGQRGDRLAATRRAAGIPVQRAELEALARAARQSALAEVADRADALAASLSS